MPSYTHFKGVLKYAIPDSIEMRSIFYFNCSPAVEASVIANTAHISSLGTYFAWAMSASAQLQGWDWYGLDPNPVEENPPYIWTYLYSKTQTDVGGRPGTQYPPHLAACIIGKTAHRRTHGRKWISPLSASDWTAGAWTGTYLGKLTDFAAFYISGWNVGGVQYYSGVIDKDWTFRDFIAYDINEICGTNNRRALGRGM